MELKPFDFYQWNKDRTQDVYSRSGKRISSLHYFKDVPHVNGNYCFAGIIPNDGLSKSYIYIWNYEGYANNCGDYCNQFKFDSDLMLEDKE